MISSPTDAERSCGVGFPRHFLQVGKPAHGAVSPTQWLPVEQTSPIGDATRTVRTEEERIRVLILSLP
jgi:hypothetical protein